MWENLKELNCVTDLKLYGETIFRLSQVAHKISVTNISDTIVLSSEYFKNYIQNRCIDSKLVEDCINQLRLIKITDDTEVVFSISVYKECNINSNPITSKANYTGIKNAITSIYERWFDGKPYSYRIAHKIRNEDTFPSVYIQPCPKSEIYSMITRQPSSGELMSNVKSWNLVHCTDPLPDKETRNFIPKIDSIFAAPQKIYFYYEKMSRNIVVTRLSNYPMTRNAYIGSLIEKHHDKLINDKCFIEHIDESDVMRFVGYTLSSKYNYNGLCISPGYANGKAMFYFSDFTKILQENYENYIFFANEFSPEHINILERCKGAIFSCGGMTSHGATYCRSMGVPAIAYSRIVFDEEKETVLTDFETINEGDEIYISAHENYWCKNGSFEAIYKPNVDEHPLQYVLDIMKNFRCEVELSSCSIDFQCHFATIIQALRKVGYDI